MQTTRITIIGTGLSPEDIPPRSLALVEQADVLIGGSRLLDFFSGHSGLKIQIGKNAAALVRSLPGRVRGKRVAVLASGDPNFFGIASLFYQAFDRREITVLPNTTAFQWAFARMKEPWDGACLVSVHGRDITAAGRVLEAPGTYMVYCGSRNTPARVARHLLNQDASCADFRTWVFDSLGTAGEKTCAGRLADVHRRRFSSLCLMVIRHDRECVHPPMGIPDEAFLHQAGMITRRDVRLMALSRLRLHCKQVLWDIGAGSGSLAIEAAVLYPSLQIWAVERNDQRFRQIKKNIKKFTLHNITPVLGSAPDVLKGLPSPGGVFIGGTGSRIRTILSAVSRRISTDGDIVLNCVTIENLGEAKAYFKRRQWPYDIAAAQLSYLVSQRSPEIFRPENQVFIMHAARAAGDVNR